MKQGINMIFLHQTEAITDNTHSSLSVTRFSASVEKQGYDMVTWVWGDIHYPPLPTFPKHIASLFALCWAGLTKVGQTRPSEGFHSGQKLGSAEPIHCCLNMKLKSQTRSRKSCPNNNSFSIIQKCPKKKVRSVRTVSQLPKASQAAFPLRFLHA